MHGLAAATVAMMAIPAVASALTIESVGLASSSGPPGSVLVGSTANGATAVNSTVTVTKTVITEPLASIRYSYSPTPTVGPAGECVTVTNPAGAKNLNPVLPQPPGTYTISFQAFSAAGCEGTSSAAFTSTVTAISPAENPPKELECGLRVALVLDESSSISEGGAIPAVRKAAEGFVTSLENTGATVAIIPFSITAREGVPYTEVTQDTIGGFTRWINNEVAGGYNPAAGATRQGTNWDAAFSEVAAISGSEPPNLVVFVTDGDPNTANTATGNTTPNIALNGSSAVMGPAVEAADKVKEHSRIFAIGVGGAVNNPASKARLTAVSGQAEFLPGGDFTTSDYTTVEFDALGASMAGIVARLCGSSLTITKYVSDGNGEGFAKAPGWKFTTTLDTTGSHTWLEPSDAGTGREASAITNNLGQVEFHWRIESSTGTSTLGVTHETGRQGFHLVLAVCQTHHADDTLSPNEESTTEVPGAVLGREEFRTCEIYNVGPAARLTVVKRLEPSTDPGRFDLLVNGAPVVERAGNGASRELLLGLGTHTVGEQVYGPEAHEIKLDEYSITTTCVDETTHRTLAHGTGSKPVSVTLAGISDDVVCTITNHRHGSPPSIEPPPGGPIDPPICHEISPGRAECPSLVVTKEMPTHARVGEVVRITITVRNTGLHTAEAVHLHDTPSNGGRIVHVIGLRATPNKDGGLTWNLGDLAPGESRTVHALMRVTRGGSLLNTALANASNADPAVDEARLHAHARHHHRARPAPPPVTG